MTSTDAGERAVAAAAKAWGWDPAAIAARPLESPFFRAWSFCRVHDQDVVPPTVAFLALGADQVDLLDPADGFRALTAVEPVHITSAADAVAYVRFFLAVTEHMTDVALPDSDLTWSDEEARREWTARIEAPAAERHGAGWRVRLWLVDAGDLLRASFTIDERGALTGQRAMVRPCATVHIPL